VVVLAPGGGDAVNETVARIDAAMHRVTGALVVELIGVISRPEVVDRWIEPGGQCSGLDGSRRHDPQGIAAGIVEDQSLELWRDRGGELLEHLISRQSHAGGGRKTGGVLRHRE
jgi:hypothetical protein